MQRGTVPVMMLIAVGLIGCGAFQFAQRDPWRDEAEQRCLASNPLRASAYLEPARDVGGPGVCGMMRPFRVAAIGDGMLTASRAPEQPVNFASRVKNILGISPASLRARAQAPGPVAIEPKATLACPLITALDRWLLEDVQPAAASWFGEPVVEMHQLSSYACRSMNGQPGANISEHAFGNALDVAAFRLASGREVKVKDGWRGRPEERGFLRQIHAAACERFSTVLGPGADPFHYDHIHVDLARRTSGRSVCKPVPQEVAPPARPYPESMPMTSRGRDPYAVTTTPAPSSAPRPVPPSRYASPPAPVGPDPMFANRPLADLPPPDLAPPGYPAGPRPVSAAPRAAGEPLDLTAPRATPHPRPGLRPPASIPTAGRFDPQITGSIDNRRFYRDAPAPDAKLPEATPGED